MKSINSLSERHEGQIFIARIKSITNVMERLTEKYKKRKYHISMIINYLNKKCTKGL